MTPIGATIFEVALSGLSGPEKSPDLGLVCLGVGQANASNEHSQHHPRKEEIKSCILDHVSLYVGVQGLARGDPMDVGLAERVVGGVGSKSL